MAKGFLWAWIAFLALFVLGGKTVHVFRGLFVGSLVFAFLARRRLELAAELTRLARAGVRSWISRTFIGAVFAASIAALIFDFEALNGTFWDLTQYIQAVFSIATHGRPEFWFHGQATSNYAYIHSSLSMWI